MGGVGGLTRVPPQWVLLKYPPLDERNPILTSLMTSRFWLRKREKEDLRGNWEAVCPVSSPPESIFARTEKLPTEWWAHCFWTLKKTRFCMVFQCIPGMYCKFVCLHVFVLVGWSIVLDSSFYSPSTYHTSHYTELQIPADKCHIWTKPTIPSNKFSPFFEIPTFLSELKVKASPLLSFLTK